MSNISRRKFLKGAGAAVLAVAASGMLTACGSEEKVPMKEVVVIFKNQANKEELAPRGTVKVPAADGTVDPSKVTAPDNFVVVSNEPVEIQTYTPAEDANPAEKAYDFIEVEVTFGEGMRSVDVYFMCDGQVIKRSVKAKFNASVVALSEVESQLPKEYEIIDAQKEYAITDGKVNVSVKVRTVMVEYCFNCLTKTIIFGKPIITGTDTVMSFERPMLATVEEVPITDGNIPSAFSANGKNYKVVYPKTPIYPVETVKTNGEEKRQIKIEVEEIKPV